MFGYDKINIVFSYHWIILIVLFIISFLFTLYSYRYTLPEISKLKKIFLISLRFIALVLLIMIFFEPILFLQRIINIKPTNLIFVDDSKSISFIENRENLNQILNRIFNLRKEIKTSEFKYFKFGSTPIELNNLSLEQIQFNQQSTNLSEIFRLKELLKDDYSKINVQSISILTDGIVTEGGNPIYLAEKSGIPVYILAVGDSSRKKDIFIPNVLYNDNIYLGKNTTISAIINNIGYSNTKVAVSLYKNDSLIQKNIITLNPEGTNTVNFEYSPKEKGEQKLKIEVEQIKGESNTNNNFKSFFLNVTEDKTNVLLISGAPNPDLTMIKNALNQEESFRLFSLTQIQSDMFLEGNFKSKLDSANIIFLIGFPNKYTSNTIYNELKNKVINKKIPLLVILNFDVDINRLKQLEAYLPIRLQNISGNYIKALPDIVLNSKFDLLSNIDENQWGKLPPILYPSNLIAAKAESKIVSQIKTESINLKLPLIVQRSVASSRSICFVGKEFWRWKLQTANDNITVFDNLILNSAKWLSVKNGDRRFKIKTFKKFYSTTENVEFVAELYDELQNPLDNAKIEVNIKSQKDSKSIILNNIGNGLYEGKTNFNRAADYKYIANAKINNSTIATTSGKFNVGDVDAELIDLRMNYELLSNLSKRTNGELYYPIDFNSYINNIKKLSENSLNTKTIETKVKLWSSQWLLMVVIALLSIEWFIRKKLSLL